MIQPDTTKMEKLVKSIEGHGFQRVVSVFAFIFAFICLIMVLSQINYFMSKEQQNVPAVKNNITNNNSIQNNNPPPKDDFFRGMPRESPFMLTFYLIGFIVNFFSGLLIQIDIRKKEKRDLKSKVVSEVLLPQEKLVIKLLEENNRELTQREIVNKSGLNKLKVSRVIKRLESLNIIEKFPYGMTNNIKLVT